MNLGVALSDLGRFEEAMGCLQAALRVRPDSPDAIQNVGMTLGRQGRWREAIDYYEQALRLRPDFPEVHRNRAYAWLTLGDYQRGWPEHEWRIKCRAYRGYRFDEPLWNGENLQGRPILLHVEQGYGDALQFFRFAPLVKQRGGLVLLMCQKQLLQLAARCPGVDLAFDGSTPGPCFQVHAPLMSLPAIFGTTLETLPTQVPYLVLDAVIVDHWRSVLAGALGRGDGGGAGRGSAAPGGDAADPTARPFLIGVAWQGSPAHSLDRWRSFPLVQFARLAKLPGVRLISLQAEHGLDQLHALDGRFAVTELPGRRPDFMHTAAIMTQLDLVITPDTALAHLAGALGVRVWVGHSTYGDWRWIAGRDDSPWYPTMRLFRQAKLGDWDDVFRRMGDALERE
jgi:hypothetical protein